MEFEELLPALSWSPDGKWLAFAEMRPGEGPARIVRLSLETLEKVPITSPPESAFGDTEPAYSPDGSQLAFVRQRGLHYGTDEVWVQPTGEGEPRRLAAADWDECSELNWTADGREILFSVRSAVWSIRRVSLAGDDPRPVTGIGQNARGTSIRGDRMVYTLTTPHSGDIWRIPGRAASAPDGEPKKMIFSSATDAGAAYSPDGQRIAFHSMRSGVLNIWVCDRDGSHAVQLTTFERQAGTPRWSPDGRRIVFDSVEAGDGNVYIIDAEGGIPRRLTPEASTDETGNWSRDGRWIYLASDRSGRFQTWKMPAEGGEAVQVTRGGGHYAEESWDGQYLYYVRQLIGSGIWRVPTEGGDETEIVSEPLAWFGDWALSRSGIYYATERAQGRREDCAIHYLDLESGKLSELYRKAGPFGYKYVAVSPDEEWILFSEYPPEEAELMLVENFR